MNLSKFLFQKVPLRSNFGSTFSVWFPFAYITNWNNVTVVVVASGQKLGLYVHACLREELCILKKKKMQLDVDVSPPANIMTFRLTLGIVTFDPDPE